MVREVYIDGEKYDSAPILLHFSCKNLKNMDTFSLSDPQIIIYSVSENGEKIEVDKTEIIWDNLNPVFSKSITLDYIFERRQDYFIKVIDIDNEKTGEHDLLGTANFALSTLVGSWKNPYTLDLNDQYGKKSQGQVMISFEKLPEEMDIWNFLPNVEGINGLGMFEFPMFTSFFLKFYRKGGEKDIIAGENTHYVSVYTTETKKGSFSPLFKEFTIDSFKLCRNNPEDLIRIELMKHRFTGNHQLLGRVDFKLNDLLKDDKSYWYFNDEKGTKRGVLSFKHYSFKPKANLLNYLKMGVKLNPIFAIDFTGSNGNPNLPSSLHYFKPQQPNDYQSAIMSICNILLDYASSPNVLY